MAAKKKKTTKAPAKSAPRKAKKAAPRKKAASARLAIADVSPGITANDLMKSLSWYTDVVGFIVEERWMKDGVVGGVSLRAGKTTFMLGQDDWKKGRDRKKGEGFRLYCTTTQDIDVLAKKIESRGGTLDQQPTDQPWGMRDIALTDPDGFKITIAKETKKR
ncbi:MAG: VOC family protein [Acidobacteriota bacterium]